jgi:hypothetical protein
LIVVSPPVVATLFILGLCCWVAGNLRVKIIVRGLEDPLITARLSRRTRQEIRRIVGSGRLPEGATVRALSVKWAKWNATVGAQALPWVEVTVLSLVLVPSVLWVIPAAVIPVVVFQAITVLLGVLGMVTAYRGIRAAQYLVQMMETDELDPTAPEVNLSSDPV